MRLDLVCQLTSVRSSRSPLGDRPIITLEYRAVGQPELPPLLDVYAVDHPVGRQLLRWTCEQLGVHMFDTDSSEEWVVELNRQRESWRKVTLEVQTWSFDGRDRLRITRTRRTCANELRDRDVT